MIYPSSHLVIDIAWNYSEMIFVLPTFGPDGHLGAWEARFSPFFGGSGDHKNTQALREPAYASAFQTNTVIGYCWIASMGDACHY